MADIEEAQGRFEAALKMLEAAAARATGERNTLAGELAAATAERDRLAGELASLQENHRSLEDLTATVTGRLDGTIERVRSALGE